MANDRLKLEQPHSGAPYTHPDLGYPTFIPPDVPESLRQRRVLPSECKRDSDDLTEAVCETLRPRNVLEFMAAKSIADAIWQDTRLQRMRADHLGLQWRTEAEKLINRALWKVIPDYCERSRAAGDLCDRWLLREAKAVQEVDALLHHTCLTEDMMEAQAFVATIDKQAQFDTFLRSTTRQRRDGYREFDVIRRIIREAERELTQEREQTQDGAKDGVEPGTVPDEASLTPPTDAPVGVVPAPVDPDARADADAAAPALAEPASCSLITPEPAAGLEAGLRPQPSQSALLREEP